MNPGKDICNRLKAVRRSIAAENGIPLEVEECNFNGECQGTCPRCEAEARYLENALADRLRLGKVATVAGLALGLAATAQAQSTTDTTHTQRDTTVRRESECLEYLHPLLPNDAPEAVIARKRLRSGRPLAGQVIAEIQVILGGTPANYSGSEYSSPRFYEEKKEDVVKVSVR